MHPDAAALPQLPDPPPTLGVDLAKNVFQVCMTAAGGQPPRNRAYGRDSFMKLLGRLPPGSTVAFEACGSCHYWARHCTALGLTVRVIPASVIHSLNMASKDDRSDAHTIWQAAQLPGLHTVCPRDERAQALTGFIITRELLLRTLTQHSNRLRALLYEMGLTCGRGRTEVCTAAAEYLRTLRAREEGGGWQDVMIAAITPVLHVIAALEQELGALDLQLRRIAAGDELCRRFMAVPCIGPVTAVTVAAYMGDPQRFRNGRHFAAYLGVAPKHAGSGGRTVITGVGGAGIAPVRRVLYEAALIMLCWNRARAAAGEEHLVSPWIARLDAAHPVRESACAIANRLARILHAVARSPGGYDPGRHQLVRRLKGDAAEAGAEVMTP